MSSTFLFICGVLFFLSLSSLILSKYVLRILLGLGVFQFVIVFLLIFFANRHFSPIIQAFSAFVLIVCLAIDLVLLSLAWSLSKSYGTMDIRKFRRLHL